MSKGVRSSRSSMRLNSLQRASDGGYVVNQPTMYLIPNLIYTLLSLLHTGSCHHAFGGKHRWRHILSRLTTTYVRCTSDGVSRVATSIRRHRIADSTESPVNIGMRVQLSHLGEQRLHVQICAVFINERTWFDQGHNKNR